MNHETLSVIIAIAAYFGTTWSLNGKRCGIGVWMFGYLIELGLLSGLVFLAKTIWGAS